MIIDIKQTLIPPIVNPERQQNDVGEMPPEPEDLLYWVHHVGDPI
jgi:hypothetical protein